jgi:hypothetical protein
MNAGHLIITAIGIIAIIYGIYLLNNTKHPKHEK